MSYFISDIKKLYKSRMVQLVLLLLGIVAVADPLFVRFVYGKQPGFFEQVGANPFQFWLLMNSSGWGHTMYRTLLFVFPVLSTGLIFFYERQSSLYELLVSRKSRIQYLSSKAIAVFVTAFLNFALILGLNLVVTNLCFSAAAPLTEQYNYLIPKTGSFAEVFYQISPLAMEMILSLDSIRAVKKRMGQAMCSRILWHTVRPSIPGILMSNKIKSGLQATFLSASCPL